MAPSNFQAVNITSTSVIFSWDALIDQANGIVHFYVITCIADDNANITVCGEFNGKLNNTICIMLQVNVTGTNTMETISNLIPFTSYNCTLHAVTVSDGPLSDPITVNEFHQKNNS